MQFQAVRSRYKDAHETQVRRASWGEGARLRSLAAIKVAARDRSGGKRSDEQDRSLPRRTANGPQVAAAIAAGLRVPQWLPHVRISQPHQGRRLAAGIPTLCTAASMLGNVDGARGGLSTFFFCGA